MLKVGTVWLATETSVLDMPEKQVGLWLNLILLGEETDRYKSFYLQISSVTWPFSFKKHSGLIIYYLPIVKCSLENDNLWTLLLKNPLNQSLNGKKFYKTLCIYLGFFFFKWCLLADTSWKF